MRCFIIAFVLFFFFLDACMDCITKQMGESVSFRIEFGFETGYSVGKEEICLIAVANEQCELHQQLVHKV